MPKGGNNMDTKSDDQFLAIESTITSNKQEPDKNHKETDWENHATHRETQWDSWYTQTYFVNNEER